MLETISFILMGLAIYFSLSFHLVPSLFAGMLVFLLIRAISTKTVIKGSSKASKFIGLLIVSSLVVAGVAFIFGGIMLFLKDGSENVSLLLNSMGDTVAQLKTLLPSYIVTHLPVSTLELQTLIASTLKGHSAEIALVGKDSLITLVHILIGSIVGALISFQTIENPTSLKPLAHCLFLRVLRFTDSFEKVIFSQAKISAINTALTAVYLVGILPLMGFPLPFAKVVILITFIVGLIPVAGNLISNSIIVIISFSHGVKIAGLSLAFLVFIHKLEYFINANIIGHNVKAHAWELLIAMLVMEAVFGIQGLILAPIVYAFIKLELRQANLI